MGLIQGLSTNSYIIVGLGWWFENPRIPENESGTIKLGGTMIKGPKPTGPWPLAETQGCKKTIKHKKVAGRIAIFN